MRVLIKGIDSFFLKKTSFYDKGILFKIQTKSDRLDLSLSI